MTLPTTAVVLCTWHGERYLPEQLSSLRAQTVQPDVYVLSDDASEDDSWALLQAFAEDRHTAGCAVVLHRNPVNLGYVRHFEQALQRVDAELLFTCDQDDIWHPDKIGWMRAQFATRHSLDLLHADARLVDADGVDLGGNLLGLLGLSKAERAAMHEGRGFDVLLRRNIVTGATMAFRRRVLRHALPFAEHWAHDEWIAIQAALHGEVDTLESVVIDYRQHGGNQIGVTARPRWQRWLGLGVDRHGYLRRQVLRQEALLAHLGRQAADAPAAIRQMAISERLAHARARAGTPASIRRRLPWVAAEWRSGRYRCFGSGWRSALADVLGMG
ncbi:glycosyltransferase family 2 protein [Lysobacter pythonis]|uniref:Glycosyltransferase family 2 protein n=2 Tax=Solilutibacter pythonis TaxID=2483112 RepID=A0A3M2I1Z5_9GAMM|nr:glycosyltransferase family 2 protein [Lysobacter pythonis]